MTPHPFPRSIRRVLMTADTIGGVWNYSLDLTRGIAAHGIKVILATMGAALRPHQRAEIEQLGDAVELHESTFRLEWMDNPWSDVTAAGEWLLSLERDHQPDIIHLNGYVHAALPFQAPKLVVAHSCVISWWRAVKCSPVPPEWSRYQIAVRLGLDQANMVVAPSAAMLATLTRNYGLSSEGRVIYNGSNAGAGTAPQESAYNDRPRTPTPVHPSIFKQPVILSVGRLWDEAKNAAALAAVAPKLPWPLRIAGDTQPPAATGGSATLKNLELLGQLPSAELAEEYRRAAIYALPARYEPFGLSVLEAARHGCALVLGDIPSLREIWSGAAVFVPPNDTTALRNELVDLIDDPYRRQALGALAHRRAQNFTTSRMVDAYLGAYSDLVSGPRAQAAPSSVTFA